MNRPVAANASPKLGRWKSVLNFDNRYLAPALITSILLVGHLSFGILESYEKTALAIAVSIFVEIALGKIIYGTWPHLASAYITGISVGILLRSPAAWPYGLCSEICPAHQRPAHLESVELRHLCHAVSGRR
jgi:enediyne biosynthesis protein E5